MVKSPKTYGDLAIPSRIPSHSIGVTVKRQLRSWQRSVARPTRVPSGFFSDSMRRSPVIHGESYPNHPGVGKGDGDVSV